MASTTTTAAAAKSDGSTLQTNSTRIVDLRRLSQSELYALSCTQSPTFCDDVFIPKINRSVFNESEASRKQTYSCLQFTCPSSSATAFRRRRRYVRFTANVTNTADSDLENAEDEQIVSMLKKLCMAKADPRDSGELVNGKVSEQLVLDASHVDPVTRDCSDSTVLLQQVVTSVSGTRQKRKQGGSRKNKMLRSQTETTTVEVPVVDVEESAVVTLAKQIFKQDNLEDRDKELLNKDGVAVDLVRLGRADHPFSDEVRRRTEGLTTEEEQLEFIKKLDGQWGSRKKKQWIVDACEFGDALPVGWKISLSSKKKNGVVWLYCHRYISPSGRQFVSCKEVSSYLLSCHGLRDSSTDLLPQNDNAIESTSATDQGSSYGTTERYNGGRNTHGASRPQPVKYSFKGQSSTSMPGDSKIYKYDASAEQGLNPSYGPQKDVLMHCIAPATQVRADCAWCNNVFYYDPVQYGVQSGAIGLLCLSCSSRYAG